MMLANSSGLTKPWLSRGVLPIKSDISSLRLIRAELQWLQIRVLEKQSGLVRSHGTEECR